MQLKKKFSDESFGSTDPDVILKKPNMADANIESVSVIKVVHFLISFLQKISVNDL